MQETHISKTNRELQSDVTRLREGTERTAQRMTVIAMRNWERAFSGMIALPTAAALTTGATMLFATALLERAFEMLERGIVDASRRLGDEFDADGEVRDAAWKRDEQRAS